MSGEAPIGVFDSGVGGLTVLKALLAALPAERFVYLGDTARLPYGTKSPGTVARYAVQAAEALTRHGIKCLVVACNTASAVGLPAIRERLKGLPVLGVIEPGAAAACAASASGRIAVIATEGTLREGAYQEAIRRIRPDTRISVRPAPLLVSLAEEGLVSGPIAAAIVRHYLEPLLQSAAEGPPDTLVLGCTHFPMLTGTIRAVVGEHMHLVDSAAVTAAHVREQLGASGAPAAGEDVRERLRLLATDSPERFGRIGSLFLEREIRPQDVDLIDL